LVTSYRGKLASLFLFAIAMAFAEAAVVVYLRALYYPEGFSIILKDLPSLHVRMETFRELATVLMLIAVARVAGRRGWERFGYFMILFGIWDLFYYFWLKIAINWPASFTDWDVLFLIPLPWVGPVIAPVLVSLVLIFAGIAITRLYVRELRFRPVIATKLLFLLGTAVILFSFMRDSDAVLHKQMPEPYWYPLLLVGLAFYLLSLWLSIRRAKH
jgi:hypothetical protein